MGETDKLAFLLRKRQYKKETENNKNNVKLKAKKQSENKIWLIKEIKGGK